jgi:hypothetical protein
MHQLVGMGEMRRMGEMREKIYRSFVTLSREYSGTLTAKGFTPESMFQAFCEKLKSKSITVSGFQILPLIFLSAK